MPTEESRTLVGDRIELISRDYARCHMVVIGHQGAVSYCYMVPPEPIVEALRDIEDKASPLLFPFGDELTQPLDLSWHYPTGRAPTGAGFAATCTWMPEGRCELDTTATGALRLAERIAQLPPEDHRAAMWRALHAHHDGMAD